MAPKEVTKKILVTSFGSQRSYKKFLVTSFGFQKKSPTKKKSPRNAIYLKEVTRNPKVTFAVGRCWGWPGRGMAAVGKVRGNV